MSAACIASSTRPSIVGTTIAWVIECCPALATHSSGVNVGRYTTRRPMNSDETTAEIPAMWYGGTLTSAASSSPADAKSSVCRTYELRWLWRSTAAFGSPVVPEVNSSTPIASVSGMNSSSPSSGALAMAAASSVVTMSRPSTPSRRETMSASTIATAGAARSAMRRSSASVSR